MQGEILEYVGKSPNNNGDKFRELSSKEELEQLAKKAAERLIRNFSAKKDNMNGE